MANQIGRRILKFFGLTLINTSKSDQLNVEINDMASRWDARKYKERREWLKQHSGKTISVSGFLTKHDPIQGVVLIHRVQSGKTKVCDHLWIKIDTEAQHYNVGYIVEITGTVIKYANWKINNGPTEKFTLRGETIKRKHR